MGLVQRDDSPVVMYRSVYAVQCVTANACYTRGNKVYRVAAAQLHDWHARPCGPMHSLRLGMCPAQNVQRGPLPLPLTLALPLALSSRKVHSLAEETHTRRYATAHKLQCWKCGRDLEDLFERFCSCGMVQCVNEYVNYFDVMGVPVTFDLERATLHGRFRNLQKDLHPDKFSKRSKIEREYSEQQSSLINKAYSTLVKPLSRGQYLLEILGHPVDEIDKPDNPTFLMEMMELNEELEEAQSLEEVHMIKEKNCQTISDITTEIAKAFQNDAIEDAKGLLIKLNYYSNIDDKIKAIQQTYTGEI